MTGPARFDRRTWLTHASTLLAAGLAAPLTAQGAPLTVRDEGENGLTVREGEALVLRYHYATVPVPESLRRGLGAREAESMRRYGHPRSDYIHPLYGLDGIAMTDDWSKDHPHHRGIYWAWPEVTYKGDLGDLHALQRVFARPTGRFTMTTGDAVATIEAENEWRWDDVTPIVREHARLDVHRRGAHGRFIDLQFTFAALAESVTIARRGTNAYGGLNTRLAPVSDLRLSHHADDPGTPVRMAWQTAAGRWRGASAPASLTIFERADNPGYPGDYIQFPDLPWLQPTFPAAGTRYPLERDTPLVLRYRLWVRAGDSPLDAEYRTQWLAFQKG
ncbi:MAG: PmoA family protein [Acidobacteria bacterium]|nr:PmoA family protein [Acidobacteriota bacterium]